MLGMTPFLYTSNSVLPWKTLNESTPIPISDWMIQILTLKKVEYKCHSVYFLNPIALIARMS